MSSSGKWSKGQGGKLQKKRRIVSLVVSPEDNQVDEKVGDVLTEIMDSYAPKGTQTECMHTPLSDILSGAEMEEEEGEGKSEESFIRSLFSHTDFGDQGVN